jgi:malonate decarboxylase delta subunit
MLTLKFRHTAKSRLSGKKDKAIIGVVASGNLEVLMERVLSGAECEVDIATPLRGYDATWEAVVRIASAGRIVTMEHPTSRTGSVGRSALRSARMLSVSEATAKP